TSATLGSSARRPMSAPGKPTLVSPVRMGDCPVTNAARPAVQLCCPYQSVNKAPSFAMRSRFGVRYPITPRLYALMLYQPISSPMMKRMLGFCSGILVPPIASNHQKNEHRDAGPESNKGRISEVLDEVPISSGFFSYLVR